MVSRDRGDVTSLSNRFYSLWKLETVQGTCCQATVASVAHDPKELDLVGPTVENDVVKTFRVVTYGLEGWEKMRGLPVAPCYRQDKLSWITRPRILLLCSSFLLRERRNQALASCMFI
ncbi:hypothetical protein AVEN_182909-1 [Araneus ventricosus]|uniref:Uncharacterized protein n=1 Tax=Araneus ventricosus TaxID=182803 RepID=A0A4Y2L8S2_ARAVE|nr:hypothetical protein AVEN_182909-1 [Araneus ventricosus]